MLHLNSGFLLELTLHTFQTNDALVAPLLRLPDNCCHVEEAERMLKRAQKNRELIELYRRKNMHRKGIVVLTEVI